jgi:HK97 family phage major capsid protein
MWKIEVNELYAYPKVTQKLLEDATIDVEAGSRQGAASSPARRTPPSSPATAS